MNNCKEAFLRLTTECETTISNCKVFAKVMRFVETNNSRKRNHKPMRRTWRKK